MKLGKLEVYYGKEFDKEVIDIKGIKDEDLERYHLDFLSIILDYLRYMQENGPDTALKYIKYIIDEYISLKLPINCYRRFQSSNDFLFNLKTDSYGVQYLEDTQANKMHIDKTYNFGLLKTLYNYASEVLYQQKS